MSGGLVGFQKEEKIQKKRQAHAPVDEEAAQGVLG
jgi:hypothetical protein